MPQDRNAAAHNAASRPAGGSTPGSDGSGAPDLTPFAPRVAHDWLATEPDVLHKRVEASMVFVDLSGFTAMSEKLAKLGKEGAEEVTEVINNTFVELLAVAYEAGGSLLKFGGDALLLLFASEADERAACWAADGMRKTLRRIGRIRTSGGIVTLRMSCGVHTGEFDLFLVGQSHRELLVTGPAATRTVDMEGAATAGEILISAQTAEALPPSLLGTARDGGRLLKRPPSPPATPSDLASTGAERSELFLSTAIRRHILGGGEGAEHRQVTVAFLHYDRTDQLVSARPDEAAMRFNALIALAQQQCDEHGVTFLSTDIDHDGGKIILTGGTPDALGDDEERVLRTVRGILLGSESVGIDVRAGVHRGSVFSGTLGPFYRRTYTVMGDAVNTAARVMGRAEPGEMLATPIVLERSRTIFDTIDLEPFQAKGKAKPIPICSVGEPIGEREAGGPLIPFTGRQAELARLAAMLSKAKAGRGGVVCVTGDAGIGKSRLLEEATSAFDGRSLKALARPFGASTPYFTIQSTLLEVFGMAESAPVERGRRLAALVAEHAPSLAPWLPLLAIPLDAAVEQTPEVDQLAETFRPQRLRSSMATLLAAVAVAGDPTVVIFEDADWMDGASRGLLAQVVAQVGSMPWLLIVAGRDIEPLPGAESLRVEALPAVEAERLATTLTTGVLLPQESVELARRSGGNPMFLAQLAASASSGAALSDLPESLDAIVSNRIDTLSPTDRTNLRLLAVLGPEFELELVSAATEGRTLDLGGDLEDFVEVDGKVVRFRQAMYQQAAYEGLPYRRRRQVHDRAGEWIESQYKDPDEAADALSYHFHLAQSWDRSWRYSLVAARRARAKLAHDDAAAYYARAVMAGQRTGADDDELATAQLEQGEELSWAGQLQQSLDAFRGARRRARTPALIALLHQREGGTLSRMGELHRAARLYGRGLAYLDRQDGAAEHRWRLTGAYGALRQTQGRPREAKKLAKQAVEDAKAAGARDGLAHAYSVLYMAHLDLRDPSGRHYGEQALAIFEDLGLMQFAAGMLSNLGMEATEFGAWAQALDLYERARRAQVAAGNTLGAEICAANGAILRSQQGHYEEAEVALRNSLAVFEAARAVQIMLTIRRFLAHILICTGRAAEGIAELDDVIGAYERLGTRGHVSEAFRAEGYLVTGRTDRALADATRIIPLAQPQLRALATRLRGCALAVTGRAAEAVSDLRASLEVARKAQSPYEEGLTHRALAQLREHLAEVLDEEELESHARAADEIFERLGVLEGFVPLPAT